MPLDLSTVGAHSRTHELSYDWKTTALYALGIGARREELDYLYEGRGPKVYPSFAVVPAFQPMHECLLKTGADLSMVVHGSQSIVAHRPMPPQAKLLTTATVEGIYDMKKMAQVVLKTSSTLESGEPVVDTTWSIIVRGAGGFGGAPPPKKDDEAAVPKDRPADFRVEQATSPEQALLYRLSGDPNPLHADPAFAAAVGFAQGPILHGLCTYGFTCRAVVQAALGGDASKLRRLDGQFRRPVWPGDTLIVEGYRLGGGKIALQTSVKERPEPVLTSAWAQVDE